MLRKIRDWKMFRWPYQYTVVLLMIYRRAITYLLDVESHVLIAARENGSRCPFISREIQFLANGRNEQD